MAADRSKAVNATAITALLDEAKAAHGTFEETELKGVYDKEWPQWYAAYAVEHGIGALVGRTVTADELAQFLARTNADLERAEPKPGGSWAAYAARRMAAEL